MLPGLEDQVAKSLYELCRACRPVALPQYLRNQAGGNTYRSTNMLRYLTVMEILATTAPFFARHASVICCAASRTTTLGQTLSDLPPLSLTFDLVLRRSSAFHTPYHPFYRTLTATGSGFPEIVCLSTQSNAEYWSAVRIAPKLFLARFP